MRFLLHNWLTGWMNNSLPSPLFQLQLQLGSQSSVTRAKNSLWARREPTYIGQKSPSIVPDQLILICTRMPTSRSLIGLKGTVLLCQNRGASVGWAVQLWRDGGTLSPIGWNSTPGTCLWEVAQGAETVQEVSFT